MSYFRLYPNKNNTVFRYVEEANKDYVFPSNIPITNSITNTSWSINTNTGANPIMELQDGKGESILLFSFELPSWLINKLQIIPFKCNLKLWDAGTLYEPAIKLKNIELKYFTDDFSEGDGYSFLKNAALQGTSNYLQRDSINSWVNTSFNNILNYNLNRINEDLLFEVTNSVADAISNNKQPKFSLSISNRESDITNIYAKFIHSRHTKTAFKPYLEFIIEDTIIDSVFNFVASESNRIYLLNERGKDFVGTVTATVKDNSGNVITPAVIKPNTGIYYIEITPNMPLSIRDEYYSILWNVGGVDMKKQSIKVKNPNQISSDYDLTNLFFYPVTPYSNNVVRQGDIMPFNVISEIRGIGNVLNLTYEYKVMTMGEFEMVPWTPVSIYSDKMFFMLDTSFFHPEQQYEVFVRNKTDEYSITSNLTYKFKLVQDAQSHLRNLSASPYYSREYFFAK